MNFNNHITIPHDGGYINVTCITRIKDNLWKWDWCPVTDERIKNNWKIIWDFFNGMEFKNGYEYHILSKEWLKSYINVMIEIFHNKVSEKVEYSDQILWNKNEIKIKIRWNFYWTGYWIDFLVKNRYRKEWKWVDDAKIKADLKWEIYDPDWHGTDDKYVWVMLSVTPENLKQYILELVEEYERETWEEYEFKYGSLEPTFLDKCKSFIK